MKNHWVTVGLDNGDIYAGYIGRADVSVPAAERDLILQEPAVFDKRLMRYRSLQYQSLFLVGSTILSMAVITDAAADKRITPIGESPFVEETHNGLNQS